MKKIQILPTSLTADQRELLGEHVCQTNGGALFLDLELSNYDALVRAGRELAVLGLVELDENPPDGDGVGISFTPAGLAWALSLPEGSLA